MQHKHWILSTTLLSTLSSAYAEHVMETTVVTATREAKNKFELAESISSQTLEDIQNVSPSHPADILNRSAGVYVNNLGGEGHMTAIRQPISTSGVYLFLEDGIPTRPTGFFNHNGLYEVNIPQSGKLEVTKGPGSALYGSDAVGGIINSITQKPAEENETLLDMETGSHGWNRVLASNSNTIGKHGYRINLNVTDNDGYRDESAYDRQSLTTRWDIAQSETLQIKNLLSYTLVDQSGVSGLEEDDYKNDTEKNLYHDDIGFRDVEALRISSKFNLTLSDSELLTLTPFVRHNQTDMMPSWMVTYDPNIRETEFQTYGFLSKYRKNLDSINGQIIAGADIDYTPANYNEKQITVDQVDGLYTGYSYTGRTNYDYDATQTSVSPYLHFDMLLLPQLRMTAGLRYDYFEVDYEDNLDDSVPEEIVVGFSTKRWYRPDDQKLDYDQLSPKFGLVYAFSDQHNTYFNYRHAFVAPSVGRLFRAGSTTNSEELKPTKSDNIEIGFRGISSNAFGYEVAVYHMQIDDKIVSYLDDGTRKTANAGETEHRGIEFSFFGDISDEWSYNLAFTRTQQEYKEFEYIFSCYSPACGRVGPPIIENRNFAGYEVGKAPKTLGNFNLAYQPLAVDGLRLELEWVHVGKYYTDENNTQMYDGHDLLNFRARYQLDEQLEFYGRIENLTDDRYSTYTSNQVGSSAVSYRPGLPLSAYIGLRWKI